MTTLDTVLATHAPTTIAIMGLAKNTGKTTTLNACIKTLPACKTIALTSIGLDGETIDQITYLPKPKITVKKGMIIATAEATLKDTSIPYQVLTKTAFSTSLGPLFIIKVTQPGTLVIAGPSTNQDLAACLTLLKKYSDIILIDGAFNRKTFANIPALDGVILATGASLHPDMETTVKTTQKIVESFQLAYTTYDMSSIKTTATPIINNPKNPHQPLAYTLPPQKHYQGKIIYIKGAITPSTIDYFIKHHYKNLTLIITDATKLLLPYHYFTYIKKLQMTVEVIQPISLLCVTINPYRPNGHDYDKTTFHTTMQNAINIPVINVQEKE